MLPMLALILGVLANQARAARQARMDATRQHVEVEHGVLVWAHGLEQSGQLSRAAAQALAKRAAASMRQLAQSLAQEVDRFVLPMRG